MYLDCYYYHQFFFAAVDFQMTYLKSGWLMNFPVHFELL